MSADVPSQISIAIQKADLPQEFLPGLFERSIELKLVVVAGRRLIQFGQVRRSGAMCVDARTEEVVDVEDANVWHANASIDRFAGRAAAVVAQLPFYGPDADAAKCEAAATALEKRLLAVDPTCMTPNGFWETFRWDVALGDWR